MQLILKGMRRSWMHHAGTYRTRDDARNEEPAMPTSPQSGASPGHVVARPYALGVFDVLGFKNRFTRSGFEEIFARYAALIDIVLRRDDHLRERRNFFPSMKEGPYWCAGGEIALMTEVNMAYASDTLLVWANYTWTELHQREAEELAALSKDPKHDWLFVPIPCDSFLETCNELMCRSLQVGLPLRGALAVGDAILEKGKNLFLGQPLIDANMLQGQQRFIGASLCRSFCSQTIPERFVIRSDRHLKEPRSEDASGLILDWPRHWRNTRSSDPKDIIRALNSEKPFSEYYENTLETIDRSKALAHEHEPGAACPIRSNYEQFAFDREGNIAAYGTAVRRVTPERAISEVVGPPGLEPGT